MGPELSVAPQVVDLPDAAVLNWGHHRTCFVHPLDPHKCIKVPLPGGTLDQSLVEHDYYRHLARRRVPLDHVAACHGWVDTSRGRGLVFDRIEYADGDDSSSVNLERAISTKLLEEKEIESGLRDLVTYLREYRILWSDENPKNICVTRRPSLRFIIVDGLGGRTALDLKYRLLESVPLLARLYTAGKIDRLMKRVDALRARASAA
jgi:hypothetical protein